MKQSKGWLSFPNYYFYSTIYILFAPMAAFRILQAELTRVDLEVDPSIKTVYVLAKHLYRTFSADGDLASKNPEIKYEGGGRIIPEELSEFLLDRESKDSILQQLDIGQINDYFPEYEKEIKRVLNLG